MSTGEVWDPARYLQFGDLRHRPALDLLARVDHDDPEVIHDVGCGTGTLARLMAARWPDAQVTGSDASAAMLAEAAAVPSRVEWRHLDIVDWPDTDDPTVDIITANAVMHWVPDHDELLLRLLRSVRPGGTLAVQMPRSWDEPSHRAIRETLHRTGLGSPQLRSRFATAPVAPAEHYADLLAPVATHIEIWETRYLQTLSGPDPVLAWVQGTTLGPILADIGPETDRFLDEVRAALRIAYPPQPDGTTRYPFPRLFIVAGR